MLLALLACHLPPPAELPVPPPAPSRVLVSRHPGRPQVVAHRGASAYAPENTLASYREAIARGATAAETDVHLSADGHVVVMHDTTTQRTTGAPGTVAELTWDALRLLDAGAWYGAAFAGERVPELGELLDLTRGRMVLCVEIKAGQHGPAVRPHAGLGERRDLVRERLHGRPRLPFRDHAVHEPDGVGLLRADGPPREHQVERAPQAHDARQPDGAAVDERHAPTSAEHAEHGVVLAHPQVAPAGQFQPAGHGVPRDRGDHRLVEHQPRRPHRPVAVGRQAVRLAPRDGLQIGPGAEGAALPPEHGHVRRVVRREHAEGVGQRVGGGAVDGVARLDLTPAPGRPAHSRPVAAGRRRQRVEKFAAREETASRQPGPRRARGGAAWARTPNRRA